MRRGELLWDASRVTNAGRDWFERLVGFREAGYCETRRKLRVEGGRLRSLVNGRSFGIGQLEIISLDELRQRAADVASGRGKMRVQVIQGDVRALHHDPAFAGALFQVASQFNLLEMTNPDITPEYGVTRYQSDPTQGPACAIACGAATLYRNYFTPVGDQIGQTRDRQIDCLADMGKGLASVIGIPVVALWTMRNGYAQCSQVGLEGVGRWMKAATFEQLEEIRGRLKIGIHWDVEVTDIEGPKGPRVSQAFCSALPVASFSEVPAQYWQPLASLVLDAAYEATLWAAVCNARRGASNIVLLTQLGGGAFGNRSQWILDAMRRALQLVAGFELEVKVVSYGEPSADILALVR